MRCLSRLGACLLGLCALSALTAVGASAEKLPAWGQCVSAPNHEGRYSDSGCVEPVKKVNGAYTGGYEWYPLTEGAEPARLQDRIPPEDQPVASTTFTLADGYTITCQALSEQTQVPLSGARSTSEAPDLAFRGCRPSAPEAGSECRSAGAEEAGEINMGTGGIQPLADEPGSWTGALRFIEGKTSSEPSVGLLYTTEPPKERFLRQIVCEGGPVAALTIGGKKSGEQLTTAVAPVNVMAKAHTLTLRQAGGVQLPASFERRKAKPELALVNGEHWEPIGIETTMLFPESEPGPDSPEPSNQQLELKATR